MVLRLQNSIPRTLWPVYRPPFSEALRRHLLSSQSVATSVLARRGCLLPILETRCEKPSQTVSDRERHTQPPTPTQLRVKPATTITPTVNAATAGTKPGTYTPTTTAVNVTTDTTYKNANARTTESTYATTIVPIAYTTKDEGDGKRCTEGWNTEGEWMGGGQRDKTGGTRTKASTTAQNDDDKWSYRPGHIPRTTDSHGASVPIPVAHVSAVPVAIDTFANRAPCDVSALRSSNKNPWGSLSRRRRRAHPHENNSIHTPVYLLHHPKDNLIHKNPAPSPLPALIRVFEKVYHPHGIGLTKPVYRVPVPTRVVTPDSRTQSRHLHTNVFSKPDTLTSHFIIPSCYVSSTFISAFLNGPSMVISNIIACSLSLPASLFSPFRFRHLGIATRASLCLGGALVLGACRERRL
jgi:hypothetical protein